LLGIFFNHEDTGKMLLRNQTAWRYIPEDGIPGNFIHFTSYDSSLPELLSIPCHVPRVKHSVPPPVRGLHQTIHFVSYFYTQKLAFNYEYLIKCYSAL
jgi:hypothetical protein